MNGYKKCSYRWAVDVEEEMARGRFQERLMVLPQHEQKQVLSFIQPLDQNRALISRLMQRCCVCRALDLEWRAVTLELTKGRKPFTTNTKPRHAPNFNYNVSHEGRYVVLASDPLRLVGVDVAAPRSTRPGPAGSRPLEQYLQAFRNQFAECEWALLQDPTHDGASREAAFQRLWSLKEAFTKARGDGLGFHPLSRAAFQFPNDDPWAPSAFLVLDGKPQSGWNFQLDDLPYGHYVSVALGPVTEVVDAFGVFRGTLLHPHVDTSDPPTPEPARRFTLLQLDELLVAASAPSAYL